MCCIEVPEKSKKIQKQKAKVKTQVTQQKRQSSDGTKTADVNKKTKRTTTVRPKRLFSDTTKTSGLGVGLNLCFHGHWSTELQCQENLFGFREKNAVR